MERLTQKALDSEMVWFKDKERLFEPCEMSAHQSRLAIAKLAAYEDAEEHGLLLRLPCNEVWFSCDKGTKCATVMSKSINDLTVYEIRKIDKDGRYWSSKKKAEAKLAEMEGAE